MSEQVLQYRDISVEEQREDNVFSGSASTYWEAEMRGYAMPSGVQVIMSRTGNTAAEAIDKLVVALKEQGYEVGMKR